jgi:outer membrane cobalamin receptor
MKHVLCVGILLAFLCSSTVVFSEGAPQKDPVLEHTLEEIFVYATKTTEKRKDIPNSVIGFDQFDIEESPARSIGELLGSETGIDWRTLGDFGGAAEALNIRGMSDSGTLVRINGVTVNSPSLGTADIGRIPLNSIAAVEVTKGSGSLLYGSGAMGGTVNLITKRPTRHKTDLNLSAGYGTEKTYILSAEQGMYITDHFGYYITAGQKETDGYRDNSSLTHQDFSVNLVFDKTDVLDISLYADYLNRDNGVPNVRPPKGTLPFTVNGVTLYNEKVSNLLSDGSDEDTHVTLNIKSNPVSWIGFTLRGDYTKMINVFNNYWNDAWVENDIVGSKSQTTNEIYGIEGNFELKPIPGAKLLAGCEYKGYDWKSNSVSLNTTSVVKTSFKEDLNTTGIYSEAQYRPSQYVKGVLGYRHENHSEFGTENLWRFGLVGNPTQSTVLKTTHGKHFRAPTPNDLFWPADGFTRGNPDLQPETGYHTDFTLEQTFLDYRVFVTASYFKWDLDNKIQWGPNSDGTWEPENLKTYKADGAEFSAKIKLPGHFTIDAAYTYLDATEENKAFTVQDYGMQNFVFDWVKRRAAYTPRYILKGGLTYRHPLDFTIRGIVRYTDERLWYRTEADGAYPNTKTVMYTLEDYWTVDLKAQKRFYRNWLVSFEAYNLFDEEYDTYFGTFSDQMTGMTSVVTYPGGGASCFFNIKYEY